MPEELTHDEKQAMLKEVASSDEARNAYIVSRANTLVPLIKAQSYVRQIYRSKPLEPGQSSEFRVGAQDEDSDVAWVSTGLGRTPRRQLYGDRIFVPTFYIDDAVEYDMSIAEEGRWDEAMEQEDILKNRIIRKENLIGFTLITTAIADASYDSSQTIEIGTAGNGTRDDDTGEGFFSKQLINRMIIQMDTMKREMNTIFLSPLNLGDLREWTETQIDATTRREYFVAGGANSIWDVQLVKVNNSTLLDDETVYGFDTRYFGVFVERKALDTREDPTAIVNWKVGIQARENIGMAVTDIKSLVKGVVDRP
jgi:hypothetical protein